MRCATDMQEFPEIKLDVQIILKSATQNLRPTIPPSTPIRLATLIKQCVIKEQEGRPDCDEIIAELTQMHTDYSKNPLPWESCIV